MDLLQEQFEKDLGLTREEFVRLSPSLGRYLINQDHLRRRQEERQARSPINRLLNRLNHT